MKTILIRYEWAMGNIWTFQIKPIKKWLLNILSRNDINSGLFPYAGKTRIPTGYLEDIAIYIDIDETSPQPCIYGDCIDILSNPAYNLLGFDCVIIDPPYTEHQANIYYNGNKRTRISLLKDIIVQHHSPKHVIIFGYNTTGMGKKRGYTKKEILIVNLGGNHNDILCTWEMYHNQTLDL